MSPAAAPARRHPSFGARTMVATKTVIVKNEHGEQERLKAGVTFIHDPRHWLVQNYPELFRPDIGKRIAGSPSR